MPNLRLADRMLITWEATWKAVKDTPNWAEQSAKFWMQQGLSTNNAWTRVTTEYLMPTVAFCPTIVADNIYEDVVVPYAKENNPNRTIDLSKLTGLAPPWHKCFIEWRKPQLGWPGDSVILQGETVGELQAGMLVHAVDTKHPETIDLFYSIPGEGRSPAARSGHYINLAAGMAKHGVRWRLVMYAYGASATGSLLLSMWTYLVDIREDGSLIGVNRSEALKSGDGDSELYSVLTVLKTFSFMNCRNVERVDTSPAYSQGAKWHRRQKTPMIKYYTLRVMKKTKKYKATDGDAVAAGEVIHRPEHICRGHDKTYTAEAPLFGKYVGKFHVAQHVRGSAKYGIIVKDYEAVSKTTEGN